MESNKPWWHDYRRKKYKPRSKANLEMILRETLAQTAKEYLTHSSVAGIKQICNSPIIKVRILWLAIFGTSFSLVCYFLFYTWTGTLTKPLIVTTESMTYPIDKINFPAVAVCNVNRISRKVLEQYTAAAHVKMKQYGISEDDIKSFYLDMERLIYFSYPTNRSYLVSLDTMMKLERHLDEISPSIADFMKEMAPKCDEMLLTCLWGGVIVECTTFFSVSLSIHGHCCIFNNVFSNETGNGNRHGDLSDLIKRQVTPGHSNGLLVFLDPLLNDYSHNDGQAGFDVFIYESTLFPDPNGGRVLQLMVQPNELLVVQLSAVKQVATSEVRKYPISTRKCLFHDELQSEFQNMYTYSACLVKCKMESIHSLCKCIPYFLHQYRSNERICGIRDLKCLSKYREKFMYLYPLDMEETGGLEVELVDSMFCPQCYPDCELTEYYSSSYKLGETNDAKRLKPRNLLRGDNFTNKSLITIYQPSSTASVLRLDVVAYWFEILSNFGGFAGIFLGLGGFTIVELLYFILVRFVQNFIQNYSYSFK